MVYSASRGHWMLVVFAAARPSLRMTMASDQRIDRGSTDHLGNPELPLLNGGGLRRFRVSISWLDPNRPDIRSRC
jgi:hypothetical protein